MTNQRVVKPFVSMEIKKCLERVADVTKMSLEYVTEEICIRGISSRDVIDRLAEHFQSDYFYCNTLYLGSEDNDLWKGYSSAYFERRLSFCIPEEIWAEFEQLALALKMPVGKAVTVVIEESIRYTDLLNDYVKSYIHKHVNAQVMSELQILLEEVRTHNPYDEEFSWISLLSLIVDEVRDTTETVREMIVVWLGRLKE